MVIAGGLRACDRETAADDFGSAGLRAGGLTISVAPAATPGDFYSTITRVGIWQDGIERLRLAPVLGIGINQFHEITPTAGNRGVSEVANAHNILLQIALDVGLLGLAGYLLLMGTLVLEADRTARRANEAGRIAAGAGLSLVAVHLFGVSDAIALGAKVGLFQWVCAGLILAASRLPASADDANEWIS